MDLGSRPPPDLPRPSRRVVPAAAPAAGPWTGPRRQPFLHREAGGWGTCLLSNRGAGRPHGLAFRIPLSSHRARAVLTGEFKPEGTHRGAFSNCRRFWTRTEPCGPEEGGSEDAPTCPPPPAVPHSTETQEPGPSPHRATRQSPCRRDPSGPAVCPPPTPPPGHSSLSKHVLLRDDCVWLCVLLQHGTSAQQGQQPRARPTVPGS